MKPIGLVRGFKCQLNEYDDCQVRHKINYWLSGVPGIESQPDRFQGWGKVPEQIGMTGKSMRCYIEGCRMNYRQYKREQSIGMIIACSFLGAAFLALTSCATVATVKTDEEQVAQRAQEWLDAVRQRDFVKAVAYTTPAFRQAFEASAYSGRYAGAATWTAGEVGKIGCEEDRCDVQIMVTYRLGRPRIENSRPLDKVWIKVENQWYIYES